MGRAAAGGHRRGADLRALPHGEEALNRPTLGANPYHREPRQGPLHEHTVQTTLRPQRQDRPGHRRLARPGPADGRGAGRGRREDHADLAQGGRPGRGRRHLQDQAASTRAGSPPTPATRTGAARGGRDPAAPGPSIDILVNNAGATWGAPAEDYPLPAWDKVMNLNIRSSSSFSQAVGKASMIPRRAAASSTWRQHRRPGRQAARREVHRLRHQQGRGGELHAHAGGEWGEHGITVNALAPGFFPSKMTQGVIEHFGVDKLAAPRRWAASATTTTSRARRCCSPVPPASTSPGRSWRWTAASAPCMAAEGPSMPHSADAARTVYPR
jgi:NAD(P)-dependent dehydrogenase (short-subunit alcohol dehydrogenase family)